MSLRLPRIDLPSWGPYIALDIAASVKRDCSMAGLDDRKDAAEKKYAHDEELAFKANARRAKLLGLWVAEQIGKSAPTPRPTPRAS